MIFYLKTQWWVNWCLSITPSTFIFHRKTPRDYSSSSISISIFSTFHQGSRHKIPTWTSSYVSVSTGQPWERGWGSLFLTPTWLLGVSLAYADLSEFVLKSFASVLKECHGSCSKNISLHLFIGIRVTGVQVEWYVCYWINGNLCLHLVIMVSTMCCSLRPSKTGSTEKPGTLSSLCHPLMRFVAPLNLLSLFLGDNCSLLQATLEFQFYFLSRTLSSPCWSLLNCMWDDGLESL